MSGDDGLRKDVAKAVAIETDEEGWTTFDVADAVLALPELAALRAKAAGYDRVRAIADEDTWGEVDPLDHRDRIRHALDGDPC